MLRIASSGISKHQLRCWREKLSIVVCGHTQRGVGNVRDIALRAATCRDLFESSACCRGLCCVSEWGAGFMSDHLNKQALRLLATKLYPGSRVSGRLPWAASRVLARHYLAGRTHNELEERSATIAGAVAKVETAQNPCACVLPGLSTVVSTSNISGWSMTITHPSLQTRTVSSATEVQINFGTGLAC